MLHKNNEKQIKSKEFKECNTKETTAPKQNKNEL